FSINFIFIFLIYSTYLFFFFNDTATTEIYTLSLHDALPILAGPQKQKNRLKVSMHVDEPTSREFLRRLVQNITSNPGGWLIDMRSEEHTSELQSRGHLVCRLLLEKKKNK